jgi:S-layer protein (TIGR01567 family)
MMNLKCLAIWLSASMLIGCGCAAALPFSGETVQLTGNQTGNIAWNESNFEGFCYNLNSDACIGTETLMIGAGALEGADIDRFIDAGNLTYTTSPIWQEYELHKNLGLTVEDCSYEGESGYRAEFWMGERYVAVGGNASKLAKPLVEFNDTDTKSLAIGEEWALGGGFTLTAMAIDLESDKVWLSLFKNGKEIDSEVIGTGSSDLQDRVYTCTEDVAGEEDVPIFSCYVSELFRGTDSSMIRVKYVFLIDNSVIQISTGEYYGNMQVRSITPDEVTLGNWDSLYLGQHSSTCQIMGNLCFKTVNNDSAIEFYPHLIRDELPVLSGGGGFVSDHCGWYQWDLYENYTLGWNQVDLEGAKAWIILCKDGAVVDERILTEEQRAPVDPDCRYSYVLNGTEIINATLKSAFHGSAANAAKLVNVTQYSDTNGTALIVDGSHLYKTADPDGMAGELAGGYVLTVKDIDRQGDKIWLELSTNGIVLKEDILRSDDRFRYRNDDGLESVDCIVEAVFRGCNANVVKLKNVTQYAGTGVRLIENESMTYPAGVNDQPMIGLWALEEGYSLSPRDIGVNGGKVWLLLLKDGKVMKDAIIDSGRCDADRWFRYHNVTGALVFSTYVDVVFRGMESNVVQLRHTTQYSEIDGSVFGWAKNILPTGIVIIAPPTITGYNPDSYVSDLEGVTREFNIATDQPSDVVWYIDGIIVKDTEKGVMSAYYTNDSAKTGYWNVSAVASNAKGTDTQTWWWSVTPSGHSTGFRIWDANREPPMDLDYIWDARSCTGFYYDIDDDISTETLTVKLGDYDDRNIEEGNLKYITTAADADFEYDNWGSYKVIGFMAEKYFAGYEDGKADMVSEDIRLISKDMLSKVLIDEDEKHMISTGASLELKEGYELKIIRLDIDGGKAQIELMKDGKSVDTDIVTSPDDYVYAKDLGKLDDVPLVVVHIDSVFAGTESDMLTINGIFQISDDPIPIDAGEDYGKMEIQSTSSYTITMENSDDLDLEEGEIVEIMGNLKFLVAGSGTLRFALYEEMAGPGTHDIRGTVYDTTGDQTWDHMNFEGFYYNIDDDLGTEELRVKEISGTTIDEGELVYTTTPQLVSFDYSEWGSYEIIGFMAEPYFAGYDGQETDDEITNDDISLISKDMLSKVLIDVEDKRMITTGASLRLLQLEEGYELKLIQLDIDGGQAQIELLKNGRSVDTDIVKSPDTYVYKKDLGKLDDVPIVVVYISNVFAGTESDMLTIDGIFQISDNPISIDTGCKYGEMEITSASSSKIEMKNPDDIDLDEGGKTMIMGDIGFMTSDDGDRYTLFVRRTVGSTAALKIELPERLVVGEEIVITITADGSTVAGTQVKFAGENLGLTDLNGEVRVTPDAAGTFMVTASKTNYNSASIAVRIVSGSTAAADAVIALQLAVSGGWDADADASGDGKVTSLDALMILQMAAKDSGAVPEIVINELMPNPIGTDRGNETTELYNCGDEPVDIGGWALKNEDGATYNIPAGTIIEPYGYYLTTKVQLDNGGGYVLLYRDGEEVDSSIAYTPSTDGLSGQRRIDGLDTDSDGDWIERDSAFGVSG